MKEKLIEVKAEVCENDKAAKNVFVESGKCQ